MRISWIDLLEAGAKPAAGREQATRGIQMTHSTDPQECRKNARDPVRRYLKSMRGRSGPGFLSLLALLFIGLKLTGHIDWSWVWVLSPLWGKVLFVLVMVAAAVRLKKKIGGKPSGET